LTDSSSSRRKVLKYAVVMMIAYGNVNTMWVMISPTWCYRGRGISDRARRSAGGTSSNVGEAAMMRDMMSRAARVAILADSSKFGRRLFAQICELGSADYLVTESKPPPDLLDALSENGVEVITPETASSSS
jgi:hypothetical protein